MKRLILAALLCAGSCAGQETPTIKVSYRMLNGITVPESFATTDDGNIGVVVFLKTTDTQVGKIDVELTYIDAFTGNRMVASRTATRQSTRAGFQSFPVAVLFSVRAQSIIGVMAYGYRATGPVGMAP
jgi:hypothetical protein